MIETINIDEFEVINNFILVQVDPNYNFIEIDGPAGKKVTLQIVNNVTEKDTNNISISGTVLKTCERLFFDSELKTHPRGETIESLEYEARMRSSMPWDVDLNVESGDKIVFNYKCGMDAEETGRLLKAEGIGYVMLMRYDEVFAKITDGDLVPLNGWVLFLRDQKPNESIRESGIIVVEKTDKYGSLFGTVIAADEGERDYIEKSFTAYKFDLLTDQRIFIQRKFGYRLAYDMHAGELKGLECIKRKNILALID